MYDVLHVIAAMGAPDMTWHEAVKAALQRMLLGHPDGIITLAELKERELRQIVRDTGARGKTPDRTLERVCQELRDLGILEFLSRGVYRIVGGI
jgi:putative restriction endonuclease